METIDEYTQEQAIEDGFIIPLPHSQNTITRNAYEQLKTYYKKTGRAQTENELDFLSFIASEIRILHPYAIQRWQKKEILCTDFRFKVGKYKHSKRLWFVMNPDKNITVMKPEDY